MNFHNFEWPKPFVWAIAGPKTIVRTPTSKGPVKDARKRGAR